QGGAYLADDGAAQRVVVAGAGGEDDEQQQLAGGIGLVALEVDDEAVDHLVHALDHRVELGGADAHPAAVEGGVAAAGDDAGAVLVDGDPVAVAPHPGVDVEVGGAV